MQTLNTTRFALIGLALGALFGSAKMFIPFSGYDAHFLVGSIFGAAIGWGTFTAGILLAFAYVYNAVAKAISRHRPL